MRHVRFHLEDVHTALKAIERDGSVREMHLALQLLEKWRGWLVEDIHRAEVAAEDARHRRESGWGEPASG